ncbi:M28 family metallopeptidase [Streptomyces sp. NPDC002851]
MSSSRKHAIRTRKRTATIAAAGAVALTASALGLAQAMATPAAAEAPDISVEKIQGDLAELQKIAEANGGNRAHGKPGYKASIDHLKKQLDAAGFTTQVQKFTADGAEGYNLVADWPGGSGTGAQAGDVVMAGAHLDSVDEGPGINDNGSGSATLLQVALAVADSGYQPAKKLRFAWWGAEEIGLVGSKEYVKSLADDEKQRISTYLNLDMTGSPNPGYFVYDSAKEPEGSEAVQKSLTKGLEEAGIAAEASDINGRSDHAAFSEAGIANGGLFTGAEGTKSQAQAEKWGGEAGKAFDPCYHAACDTTENIDAKALDINADVAASTLWELSGKE